MGSTQHVEPRVVESKEVWTTLITNTKYLSGLLTLDYSLKKVGSQYPLIALYTDTFPHEGIAALDLRGIPRQHIEYLLPSLHKDYSNDQRFYDCWSKLTPFSLVQYDRVVQLDSDMLVLQNMDELMEMELDPPRDAGKGNKVFAASHACVCNPLNKPHYPRNWVPANCPFTTQHSTTEQAQIFGAPPTAGLAMPNGGLQVVNPSIDVYNIILEKMKSSAVSSYEFADQSLLADAFPGRWYPLPYIYNALKTLRWEKVHAPIWRDDKVKNVHYILSPKPWDQHDDLSDTADETHKWWRKFNAERLKNEKTDKIDDGF